MEKKQDCVSMCDRVWICIIFNKILRLRQCPQYTLNNVLLNFIEHMKKWRGQLDIRFPSPKIGGDVSPHSPRIGAPAIRRQNMPRKFGMFLWCNVNVFEGIKSLWRKFYCFSMRPFSSKKAVFSTILALIPKKILFETIFYI